ncbi:MAG: crossover junction endodeoxyribonuclease RuvC [Clostridiales Family XIII bacterium]|jgi:crossover junction endodeoxyribonuclease RuvC|nr:crossover junction endodeoxyribonuclease RuvC [Clostridiales Family XIII bacterium]
MKILGIDPGYAILGYGLVEMNGSRFALCDYGTVTTEAGTGIADRLKRLYAQLMDVIEQQDPDVAAIEELFFNSNAKTAILVGQARGAAILACANSGLKIYEYTPLQVKQALTGYGRADKMQVQVMVQTILRLKEIPRPDDAADALAAAICHGNSAVCHSRMEKVRGL